MIKLCTKCNQHKDISEFSKKGTKVDGTTRYQSICKECHKIEAKKYHHSDYTWYKEKARENNKRNRERYRNELLEFLSTKQCIDCGIKDIRVLEFDHLKDKLFSIGSKTRNTPLITLMPEIEKCEIVCANCHRIRTYARCNARRHNFARVI